MLVRRPRDLPTPPPEEGDYGDDEKHAKDEGDDLLHGSRCPFSLSSLSPIDRSIDLIGDDDDEEGEEGLGFVGIDAELERVDRVFYFARLEFGSGVDRALVRWSGLVLVRVRPDP